MKKKKHNLPKKKKKKKKKKTADHGPLPLPHRPGATHGHPVGGRPVLLAALLARPEPNRPAVPAAGSRRAAGAEARGEPSSRRIQQQRH